jgi:hypothetical protein
MAENENSGISPPSQSGRAKKKSKAGIIIIAVLVVAIVVMAVFFVIKTSPTLPSATNRIISRGVEDYQATWTSPAKEIFDTPEDANLSLEGQDIIQLQLPNPGFEKNTIQKGVPDGWDYTGKLDYVSTGCQKGKCLLVDVDNSDQGFLMLNSNAMDVEAGKVYQATVNVNCVKCDGEGAYLGICWMKNDPETNSLYEFKRNILVLTNTNGYQLFSIVAQAPEGAEKAIYCVRAHDEGGLVQPKTEFYIDS